MKNASVIFILIVSILTVHAQSPEWYNFNDGHRVNTVVEKGDTLWIATSGGLVKVHRNGTGERFYNITNSGIPDNDLIDMISDNNNQLWICTRYKGIVKYDGQNWEIYDTTDIPFNIFKNPCMDVAKDSSGNLYFATNFGLLEFNGINWQLFQPPDTCNMPKSITTIGIDKSQRIWCGHYYNGVSYFDGIHWIPFPAVNYNIPQNCPTNILVDDSNHVWIGYHDYGLVKFDGTSFTTYNMTNSNLANDRVAALGTDKSGNIWIGHERVEDTTISIFDGNNWMYITKSNNNFPGKSVYFLNKSGASDMLVGTDSGLVIMGSTSIFYINTSNSPLLDNEFTRIFVDRDNRVWIVTMYGVIMLDNGVWTSFNTDNSGLPINNITCITQDKNGSIWFGTYWNGIVEYDGMNWNTYSGNSIMSLGVDSSNNIWVGTWGGLSRFNKNSGWTYFTQLDYGISNIKPISIDVDFQNRVWISTEGDGLLYYDGSNWIRLNAPAIDNHDIINKVLPCDTNKYWIATNNQGLFMLNDSIWSVYDTSNSNIPTNRIYDISLDTTGVLWMTSNKGLIRFDSGNWIIYDSLNSDIPVNICGSLDIDREGNKWLSVYRCGIAVFNENGTAVGTDNPIPIKSREVKILVFPNPASEFISFQEMEYCRYNRTIKLFDSRGILVTEKIWPQGSMLKRIDVSSFLSGFYIYEIENSKGYIQKGKLIVHK